MLVAQQSDAIILGVLFGLVIYVAIVTLIGAIFSRAACCLFNKMAGGPESPNPVPEPEFGKAMGITFFSSLVNFGVAAVIGVVGAGAEMSSLSIQLISLPVGLITLTLMTSVMLPTSLGRSFLVVLLQILISIVIGVVVCIPILLLLTHLKLWSWN